MLNKFFEINPKLDLWYRFTRCCFNKTPFPLNHARSIAKLAIELPKYIKNSRRDDFLIDDLEDFIAHILGVYFTTVAHHNSIQILSVACHEIEALIILRPQLEALLILLYFIEPHEDIEKVFTRVDKYRDWLLVKMKKNMDRSYKFDLLNSISSTDDFQKSVLANYDSILEKYCDFNKELKSLTHSHSFLKDKRAVARAFDIEDLFDHIYAESSASIHIADISDRMQESEKPNFNGYEYRIQNKGTGFGALLMSNMIMIHAINNLSKFLGVEHIIKPKVMKIIK
jgi:hypothetical protein